MSTIFFPSFGRLTHSRRWWPTMRRTPTLFSFTQRMDCSSLERALKRCSMWRSSYPRGSASPGAKSRILSSRALRDLISASPTMSSLSRTCTSKHYRPNYIFIRRDGDLIYQENYLSNTFLNKLPCLESSWWLVDRKSRRFRFFLHDHLCPTNISKFPCLFCNTV